jgi:hypothetical protein|tara:strand:+ start:1274 stop:1714 length:441 start_codon:yes stop_codon:yes gene_type:complete
MKNWSFHPLLSSFLLITLPLLVFSNSAQAEPIPCSVSLEFDSNTKGSIANYVISLQVKNTTGRTVTGTSIIYQDANEKYLGNTLLTCRGSGPAIKPGSYGECRSTLQKVDGEFIDAFGTEKWTEIVNTQLKTMTDIAFCEILGFSY